MDKEKIKNLAIILLLIYFVTSFVGAIIVWKKYAVKNELITFKETENKELKDTLSIQRADLVNQKLVSDSLQKRVNIYIEKDKNTQIILNDVNQKHNEKITNIKHLGADGSGKFFSKWNPPTGNH